MKSLIPRGAFGVMGDKVRMTSSSKDDIVELRNRCGPRGPSTCFEKYSTSYPSGLRLDLGV